MNKRTLARAARLYSLGIIAHMDAGGAETDEETAVTYAAMEAAARTLETMGLNLSDVATRQRCIALAKSLDKN